jgi:hypothetical protein
MNWYPKHYLSILCFDGEGEGDAATAAVVAAAAAADVVAADAAAVAAAAAAAADDKKFSQIDVNKFMAEENRKHKESLRKLETSMQTLSEDRNLSEQQRSGLATELEDLRKSLRTKEQQIEYDRKQAAEQYKTDLDAATHRADHWEQQYRDTSVDRALQDAASDPDVYNVHQIINLLKPHTELKEVDGALTTMINFPDVDEKTGKEIVTLRTPADAVKRMKEMPKVHGNLFKSGVVSGVGSGSGAINQGVGEIDYASLTTEQYRKLRKENPEALGLSPRR